MSTDASTALGTALQRILRPLIQLLLRRGVSFLEFARVAEHLYVELAMRELRIPGRKTSVSRAAVLTGLSRKEVQKVLRSPALLPPARAAHYNRAARVIAGWVRDSEFRAAGGMPALLPAAGERGSFAALVRRYSGDIPPRAILDEVVRVGAVGVEAGGELRLLHRAYVPREASAKIEILGTDVGLLIETIHHNLDAPAQQSHFQRTLMYDNLPDAAAAELRPLVAARCQGVLAELDGLYSARDRDVNPGAQGTGRRRAGIGIYYFEHPYEGEHPYAREAGDGEAPRA